MEHGGPQHEEQGGQEFLGLPVESAEADYIGRHRLDNTPDHEPTADELAARREQRLKAVRERLGLPAKEFGPKQVGEFDPTYQLELDKIPQFAQQIYGGRVLYEIQTTDPNDEEAMRDNVTKLVGLRDRLVQLADERPTTIGSKLSRELREALPDRFPAEIQDTATALKGLSEGAFYQFLSHHVDQGIQRIETLTPEVEQARDWFKARMEAGIRRGDIPLDPQILEHRLQRLQFNFYDEYANPPRHEDRLSHAQYHPEISVLAVNTDIGEHELRDAVIHELLHAVSGRVHQLKGEEQSEAGSRVNLLRMGLYINAKEGVERFSWLDEAMTESLTLELQGVSYHRALEMGQHVYGQEQSLLKELERRVPRQVLQAAYFGTFDPQNRKQSTWGELQQQITTQFEPRLLLKLDKIITEDPDGDEEGLKKAIAYMRQHYPRDHVHSRRGQVHKLSKRVKQLFTRRDKREAA